MAREGGETGTAAGSQASHSRGIHIACDAKDTLLMLSPESDVDADVFATH